MQSNQSHFVTMQQREKCYTNVTEGHKLNTQHGLHAVKIAQNHRV